MAYTTLHPDGTAGMHIHLASDARCGMAEILAERTRSQVVQVIGRKIVLYKEGKDDKKKIVLP